MSTAVATLLMLSGCSQSTTEAASCTVLDRSGAEFVVTVDGSGVRVARQQDGEFVDSASFGAGSARNGTLVVNGGENPSVIVLGPSNMNRVSTPNRPDIEPQACDASDFAVAVVSASPKTEFVVSAFDGDTLLFERSAKISQDSSGLVAPIGSPPTTR